MKRAFLFAFLASPAIAQEPDRSWMLTEVRGCFENADSVDGMAACEYQTAEKCQITEAGGLSNLGMTACIWSEYEAWDVLLNEQYRAAISSFEKIDGDSADLGPADSNRAETLRVAQRAWIAYRDAECANETAYFGSGSMRLPVGASCYLGEVSERTIELWAKRGLE